MTKLDASSLRGHVTCPEHREHLRIWTVSARGHFDFTSKLLGSRQLDSRPLEVSSKPLGSTKLDSRPLRGHLAPSACLARLGSAWLDSASLSSARLGSARLGSACVDPGGLTQLGLGRHCSKKLFQETVRENCLGANELCITQLCLTSHRGWTSSGSP